MDLQKSTYPCDVDPGERLHGGRQGAHQLGDLAGGAVLPPDQHDLVRLGQRGGHLGSDLNTEEC